MTDKILIADRGEVVLRIARTCERLGIATVAIHDDADARSAHASGCDEAVALGDSADAYRAGDAIVAAATRVSATAVHPGCGPLRADASFARAVTAAGLQWIGAPVETLEQLASASRRRELAVLAGFRPLPSGDGPAADLSAAIEQAAAIGYPVCLSVSGDVTAALAVESEDELPAAYEECADRARARGAGVNLERWLDRSRRLSALVAGDSRNFVALGEVERSLVLADRTLVEESPAPALRAPGGELKRAALREAAIAIARECGLRGLGAADFALDLEGRLYVTGFRPELPQEHALIEICSGLDLVELQIGLARGDALSADTQRAPTGGHAVQARIFAEAQHDRPTEVSALRWPVLAPGSLRVETDLVQGQPAAVDREPMLAKVIAHGATRHQAVLTLDRALSEATLEPFASNLELVREILGDESFRASQYDISFAERVRGELRSRSLA
jgi:acetyl-CoA carboxylase biotin carboxylase subunit/3-methylcrotonyl-CoA carboxylase alpha subunit